MIIELTLLIISVVLIILAVTGYDKYIALKVRAKILKEFSRSINYSEGVSGIGGNLPSIIKKVKVDRIGSYLIITLVIRQEEFSDEKIDISEPLVLTPMLMDNEEATTS